MDIFHTELVKNREAFEQSLNFPTNKDVVFRNFRFAGKDAFIVFIDGMASGEKISDFILRPLLNMSAAGYNLENILQINAITAQTDFVQALSNVMQGDSVVCIDGEATAYICETKGFDMRGVDKPQVESSIVGSQEAFNENLRTNTTLLRRIIKHPALTTEMCKVGRVNNLTCGVMYLADIVDMSLVEEVKRRLGGVETDFVQSGGMIEQFIEDCDRSLFQTMVTTERPDNAAALLMQGRVVIIVDGSPRVIIAPVTLSAILKTSEESALRAPYASTIRVIRAFAVFTALLLPALYLAATTFHPEMIPAGLLVSLARSRLSIPYPAMLELLLMEVAFEMIREAGERIPGPLGSTIGIVGGLILGESAVSAGLVSRSCVVVIAFTALGNFAIPQYQSSFAVRLLRVVFLICAGFFGFFGIGIALVLLVGYLSSLTSLGKDFVNPIFSGQATFFPRPAVWNFESRPPELNTTRPASQPPISRKWKRGKANG
ncbi:MAG: spore germination protein [Oscillospiraceae bacterium]|nr:spore germination protein [Oscillospiraceae bacterium]